MHLHVIYCIEPTGIADIRNRVVPVARLGLLPQKGSDDDQTKEVLRRQGERRRQNADEEAAMRQNICGS